MPRVDEIYGLEATQAELDFVNITTDHDVRLFIEPYAMSLKNDVWSKHCYEHISTFFQHIIDLIRSGREGEALALFEYMGEPSQTGLGYAKSRSSGRGIRGEKARRFFNALRRSRAVQTGLMSDLGEADLFINGVSRDGISDLTANILRGPLIDYTQRQCVAWEIPLQADIAAGHIWDTTKLRWVPKYANLPVYEGDYLLFTPKYSVRRNLLLNSQEYYSHHVVNFIRDEEIRVGTPGLVRLLKDGTPWIPKSDIKRDNPLSKDFLAQFSELHPDVLKRYKDIYKNLPEADGAPTNRDLDADLDESAFARALIEELADVPTGPDHATKYHRLMVGIIEFLFYPNLIFPDVEPKLHQGRKRIDIWYTNTARDGFFHTVLSNPRLAASLIPVECKNYGRDIGNPEFDQLGGRFSDDRGWFGILCHREHADRERVMKTCADTLRDNRGMIIPLEDSDVNQLLNIVVQGQRSQIDTWLHGFYRKLLNP